MKQLIDETNKLTSGEITPEMKKQITDSVPKSLSMSMQKMFGITKSTSENVSPQVPSLETECDKEEVVEPEVLKPSDNKDCSNAEDTEISEFRNWYEEMEKIE